MPQVRFSASDDDQLIEAVGDHAYLWNLKDPNFKNVTKKDETWAEISKVLNI